MSFFQASLECNGYPRPDTVVQIVEARICQLFVFAYYYPYYNNFLIFTQYALEGKNKTLRKNRTSENNWKQDHEWT